MSPSWAAVFVEPNNFCDALFATPIDQRVRQGVSQRDINPFADLLGAACGEAPTESQLRVTVTKAVNDNGLVPGLKIYQCDELPGQSPTKPEREEVVPVAFYFELEAAQTTTRRSWADQIMPVWFEKSEVNDVDVPTRMMAYADLLFAVQQRVALFMLVLVGSRARFIRWDRSGAVVTRAFDYVEDWRFLCDALWCIGHRSAAQLGLDPTATRVRTSDADYLKMFKAANMENTVDHSERVLEDGRLPAGEFEYVRKMFADSIKDNWLCYRVEVPDGEKTRRFLIGKPAFRAKGMAGRGTRGYVALDCDTQSFVWLKDTWRASYEFVRREGDILAALNEAQIPSIPTMLYHGDIDGQKTETPDWWERRNATCDSSKSTPVSSTSGTSHTINVSTSSKGKKRQREDQPSGTRTTVCPLRLHQHYRLVVQEVAMPLDRFEFPKQLVQVMFDCVNAHWKAATVPKLPLLHRDISSGNILIYPVVRVSKDGKVSLKWRGILADWEMSKPLEKEPGQERRARQPARTGTWQYLSIALLTPGPVYVKIQDELESFLHVLIYYALRYVKSHNCNDGEAIAHFLDQYFDMYGREDGMYICGNLKRATIERGSICVGSKTYILFNNPLDALFTEVLSWFRARYAVLTHESKQASASAGGDAGPPPASPSSEQLDADVLDFLAQYGADRQPLKQPEGPSEEVRALARQLESHTGMMVELANALDKQWPPDKAGDQIPSAWKAPVADRLGQTLSQNEKDDNKRPRPTVVMSEPPFPGRAVMISSPHTPQTRRPVVSLATFNPNDISP